MEFGSFLAHSKDMDSTEVTPRVTVCLPFARLTCGAITFQSSTPLCLTFTPRSQDMSPLRVGMDLGLQHHLSTILDRGSPWEPKKMKFSWVFHGSRDLGRLQLRRLCEDNPLLVLLISKTGRLDVLS